MQSRRRFIKNLAVAGAAAAATPLMSCTDKTPHQLEDFGFISGLIGKEMKADWRGALQQAADMGFTEYEGGSYGDSPQEFLSYLKSVGLKPVVSGIKFSEDMDEVKQSFDTALALEMPYVVSYWPWFTGGPFTLEDCKKSAPILNKIGELAKANGLQFCWHNHDKEFIEMEEGLPFDYLMANTDPELVQVELDIYWVKKGGSDPLEVLKQYAGRIPILHVKDMAPGEEEDFACPGTGIIDFGPIFAESTQQGIQHYFVERDKSPDGMACLATASEYLKNLRF